MKSEKTKTAAGSKTKRRFRYLFRRDTKPQQKQAISNNGELEGMSYQFPAVADMQPHEVDKEIKLRIASLQRRGLIDCVENVVLSPTVAYSESATEAPKGVTVAPKKDKPSFKPKFFIKRPRMAQ